MQVEQTNLWENVNHNVNTDMGKGVLAYQANMPETENAFGMQKEKYEKLAEVSAAGSINMNDATYQNPLKQEDEKTVVEDLASKPDASAESRRDEVAVVANTTSVEDYKKLEEEGFSITASDSRTIITVTDKIKAVLAQAGVDVSAFGDTLSREQLEEITGSPEAAEQIMNVLEGGDLPVSGEQLVQTLEANDLPVTETNVEGTAAALEQAASLTELSEDAIVYLLKNALEPTIRNLYTAEHMSAAGADNTDSYAPSIDFEGMEEQITKIIEEAGLEVNDTAMADSKWLIEHQIPLTGENLVYLGQLRELSTQLEEKTLDWTEIADSVAKAITAGKRPENGLMITARRKLEETRLAMTTEASRAMLKRGMEIDTKPLEELVEDLKEQEKQYYRELLTNEGIEPSDENVEIFADTVDAFEEMKSQPAYVLGQVGREASIEEIHDSGETLQRELERANERYETLMTAPRKDMGDNIQKAFRNVDDILTDMNLDTSEANRRAVRILAYNETPITEENIQTVKAMDEEMQRAFRNMTPAATLEMIRRGENPLDMTVEELNRAVEQIKQETGDEEQERFSKYLWKLEQNQEISEEERSSYIGIYRLIAQVEKTDGAALGSLMNQGSDITMRNLLTAMRSTRKGAMDYTVDDDFDGVESTAKGPRIDDQIEAAFQQNCLKDVMDHISPEKLARLGADNWENMTPEQLAAALKEMETAEEEQKANEAYIKEQLASYRQVMESSKDIYSYLERYDITNSMANIMAATNMLRRPNQMMDRLWKNGAFSKDSLDMIADLKEQVLEEFGEALKNPEALADAQEKLADVAEHVMDTMLIEDPSVRTLDVRELRQMSSQFKFCAQKSKEECYMVPIQTGDSVTGVSLKVVRGKEKKGLVDIMFESGRAGRVAATFQAKDQGISGMIAVSDEETRQLLSDNLGLLVSAMQDTKDQPEAVDIKVAHVSDLSLERYEMAGLQREARLRDAGELAEHGSRDTVQTTRLYHIAESFIQSIQELLN